METHVVLKYTEGHLEHLVTGSTMNSLGVNTLIFRSVVTFSAFTKRLSVQQKHSSAILVSVHHEHYGRTL